MLGSDALRSRCRSRFDGARRGGVRFDWPQWQRAGPHRRVEGDRAAASNGRPRARRSVWSISGAGRRLRIARGQRRPHLRAGLERAGSVRVEPEPRRRQGACGRRRSGAAGSNDRGPGPRGTPTVDGDRLYVLTENGDLACLNAANGSGGLAAQHPRGFRRPADRVADQRIAARRRQPRDRHAGRTGRRHRRARQDVGQDGVGQQGVERRGGLRVADRRRRAGRPRRS